MTSARLRYTEQELLADPEFATRIRHDGRLLHGGYDAEGTYLQPRSLHRVDAIAAWTNQLADAGHPTQVIDPSGVGQSFVPNADQAKMLLPNGASGATTRILTLIGLVEGFGNDGIKLIPPMDISDFVIEPIDDTCLGHVTGGLLEAHGNDEAGRGDECGHDQMWFTVRDVALDHPEITSDMFENIPRATQVRLRQAPTPPRSGQCSKASTPSPPNRPGRRRESLRFHPPAGITACEFPPAMRNWVQSPTSSIRQPKSSYVPTRRHHGPPSGSRH